MAKITGSVGRNGQNNPEDVSLVQTLLNNTPIPGTDEPLKVDGDAGNRTISRIEAFQREVVLMNSPDGRIDPDGRTFTKLSESSSGGMPASSFEPSSRAIDLLKSIEQLAATPYDDQTGLDTDKWVEGATIGYGHLISENEWPKYKDGISEAGASELFKQDLAPFVNTITDSVTASITQNQFDAMVIFVFNIGANGFKKSSALKLINDPDADTDYEDLESAWKAWNKSQGKVSPGLNNRRNAEWKIYSQNIYERW